MLNALINAGEQVRARMCWLCSVYLALHVPLGVHIQTRAAATCYASKNILPEMDLPVKLKAHQAFFGNLTICCHSHW